MKEEKLQVSAGTVARTVILVLALINQVLTVTGHPIIPIQNETIEMLVTNLFTIGAAIWSWWKNNSFTQAALKADLVKDDLKASTEN